MTRGNTTTFLSEDDEVEATLQALVDGNPELAEYAKWLRERRGRTAVTEDQHAAAREPIGSIIDSVSDGTPMDRRASVDRREGTAEREHPLAGVFSRALAQAMYGKGERHGGAATPFNDQPWLKIAKVHGLGFLTGQAVKKIEEAVRGKTGEPLERELLGAINYLGMALIYLDQQKVLP